MREERINEEVKKALSEIVSNEIKDPRLPMLTSITDVKVSRDLAHADVYFSVFGDEEQREKARIALTSASGFIRKSLAKKVDLRATPELRFKDDRSIEKGIKMSSYIDEVIKQDQAAQGKETNYGKNN